MTDAPTDLSRLFDLHGRRALVVGAGSGIGRAAALGLAAHGAEVICADRDSDAASRTAGECASSAQPYELDLLDRAATRQTGRELDPIDVLVATPAVNVRKRLLDYSDEEYDRVVDLNLRGTFDLIRAVGPGMTERGRGSIIGFASIRATTVEPGQGVYAATKAGIVALMRTTAAELGACGVRANAIAPGVVDTPLTAQIKQQPEWYAAYASRNALGRWARADELAGAVVFLASDASSYVTGSVLTVDGGWTAIDGRFEPPEATT